MNPETTGKDAQPRPTTLKDVAERAGVSKMAVSTVINRSNSTVKVSDATRERILKALDELKYQPNAFARSLRVNFTGTVGFYYGSAFVNMHDPFARKIFQEVTWGLEENGQDLLLYTGLYRHQHNDIVGRVLSNKIDALIILPSEDDSDLLNAVKKSHVPCVVIAESVEGLPCVAADDINGSRAMAEYLLSKGHRRILYRRSAAEIQFEKLRFDTFARTIKSGGGEIIAFQAGDPTDSISDSEAEILSDRSHSKRVSAVACWRDYSALRALNYCQMNDISVPDQLAITGFDGVGLTSSSSEHTLTTVDAHWSDVARKATELVRNLKGGAAITRRKIIIPADIIIGTTA